MFHRVVHLDLKGAPWRVAYLEKIIPLFKKWGATGVLLEWEDTFPYNEELFAVGSYCNMQELYTEYEVGIIIRCIQDHGMEPIQLFQSIGHMEYVLKHKQFAHLREVRYSPAVLCPSKKDSLLLCKKMAQQLLLAQPGARFIHIGGDEAWHMNVCADCKTKSTSHQHKVAALYLDHITALAAYIKDHYNVTVLMWDDMMRSIHVDTLKEYDIGSLVQPVVWDYNVPSLQFNRNIWDCYAKLFPNVWAGSAFKGANGSCQMVCDVSRYASNQAAWQQEIHRYKQNINFSGVILTGWSRFDHYATLCELLPVALPSLSVCLKMWTQRESNINSQLPVEEWPAGDLANMILSFAALRERCLKFLNSDQIETWLNDWQIENEHTSYIQAENIAATAKELQQRVSSHMDISTTLLQYTTRRSTDEWKTKLHSLHDRLLAIGSKATDVVEKGRL